MRGIPLVFCQFNGFRNSRTAWMPAALSAILTLMLASISNSDALLRDASKIALIPSASYLAIRLNSGLFPNDPALQVAIQPAVLVKDSPILDQHRLAVVRIPPDADLSIAKLRSNLARFGTSVPVYERDG